MGAVLSSPAAGLGLSIAAPIGIGFAIGMSVRDDVRGWYSRLRKPSWNPPNWVFGPMWTTLYAMMGYAFWRVVRAGAGPVPVALYGLQAALNFAWTPLFFAKKDLKLASYEISALWLAIAATIREFAKVDETAAALLVPYLGWVSVATALTFSIRKLNGDNPKGE